jgi:O-antigen ligase
MVIGAVSGLLNLGILALNMTLGAVLAVGICIVGMLLVILLKERDRLRRILILFGIMILSVVAVLALSSSIRADVARLFSDMAKILSGRSDGTEGSGRWVLWQTTIKYISEKPLFGHGCEGIAVSMYEATGRSNPHSELLTYAAYYGIPAAIAYFAGVVSIFIRAIRRYGNLQPAQKAACMAAAGYFISSFTGVAMFYLTPFFFIFLGYTGGKGHVQRVS